MAFETTTYQCPNCGGRLVFEGKSGQLTCQSCDSTFTEQQVIDFFAKSQAAADAKVAQAQAAGNPEVIPQQIQVEPLAPGEDAVEAYLKRSKVGALDPDQVRAYNCSSCGAQLLVDSVTAVTQCPYCGNNAFVPGQLANMLQPEYVIPFKLDKNDAVAALAKYYHGKRFLPSQFTQRSHIEEIQGVYVPFWLFSGKAQADMTFNASNTRIWSDSKYDYTETDFYLLSRVGSVDFDLVPVDGSTRMPDAHMDAIEPFDYAEMVPFSMAYLPGYITDRYDQDANDCQGRATNRACTTTEQMVASTAVGYMSVTQNSAQSAAKWEKATYVLLPVWMLHTKFNGQDYLFAMNGQTGKLVGDLPIDKGKVRRRFGSIFGIGAAILLALAFVAMEVL